MKINNVKFDSVTISSGPHGEVLFDTPGNYSFTAPAGVTSVSVVCVGGGGGGASSIDYGVVAGAGVGSYFVNTGVVAASGGSGGGDWGAGFATVGYPGAAGGVVVAGSGTNGAASPNRVSQYFAQGGGGAGLLNGATGANGVEFEWGGSGGTGANLVSAAGSAGGAGTNVPESRGGNGGSYGGGGGAGRDGMGGGGGAIAYINNYPVVPGTNYQVVVGNGGAGKNSDVAGVRAGGSGAGGAVRIIWPGIARQFPSTNVRQVTDYGFDIVRPVEFYVDATNPASYTNASTALNDVSGNNINGTVTAGTTLSGPGITFNGSSQTANFGDVLPSIAGNAFSFGCWVKFNNVTTAQTVMGKQSATNGRWTFGIQTTGYIIANIGVNGIQPTSGSAFFGAYLWTHVTITFSSTGTISIYFNGLQAAISGFAAPVTSSTGSVYVGSAGASEYLNGVVGEAFFYRKALTAAEVLQNYTNTKWKYGL
jgi:hypothetical protein